MAESAVNSLFAPPEKFAEQARVSMKLVTLDKDTPVPQPLDSLIAHKPTAEQLGGFLREQNF